MKSTTCGEPSAILLIASTGMPIREIAWAVPPVAMMRKPRSWKRAASCVAAALSPSVTVMKTVPSSGSETPAAAWALPNAVGKSRAMPITSPVDFISGPEHGVGAGEAGERQHGLLDRDVARCGVAGTSWSARRSPSIRRHAIFASGAPIAFETNGIVREARGFASIT